MGLTPKLVAPPDTFEHSRFFLRNLIVACLSYLADVPSNVFFYYSHASSWAKIDRMVEDRILNARSNS